jgi:hypothetical protein
MKIEDLINNFNLQLQELFTIIEAIYTDENIKRYKLMVKTVIKLNATKLIEQYIIHAIPYSKFIYNKDDNFFLHKEVNEIREKISETKIRKELHETSVIEILKIKTIWQELDNDTKDIIWEYFQLLTYYAQEYFKIKYDMK